MTLRELYASKLVPNTVFIIKSVDYIPRFTPGIIFQDRQLLKLHKDSIYNVYFPIPAFTNSRLINYKMYGNQLQLVKGHPLSKLIFKDINYLTDDLLIQTEENPLVYEIKPGGKLPGMSKKFVYELVTTLSNVYQYCWSYTTNVCNSHISILKKVAITSIKNVFPIFDQEQCNGVCVCVYAGHPLDAADLSQGLVFLLSNYQTNITIFDGAKLRSMENNLTATAIRSKIYSFTNIYSIKEDRSVCAE